MQFTPSSCYYPSQLDPNIPLSTLFSTTLNVQQATLIHWWILWVARISEREALGRLIIMNWKGLARWGRDLFEALPRHLHEGTKGNVERTRDDSQRLGRVRIGHRPSTNVERYGYADPLGKYKWWITSRLGVLQTSRCNLSVQS
jgi:hypothetical protein